ncbi:hypothetical protein EN871_24260 [bacterium M00.F.Ca.ET.228.01.1.1]|uniref:hypothetical protein n=1 Tax=Paraburkholderia phenoliruptrix TaxID=252970 RepID=UPI001091F23E|nr:hypothetical protein [Paraburkholderia phenoliruptrix]TGP41166.1 hypothetical protein EN871_24260 [bacterium M00.F.Ca.ET.228.01.1.1]TGR97712.1 hypothetical protein EN834_23875 [bacterium M00.F.Ca.ET.191.01.1.1]TGU01879.1 hypothetical protein EN798_24695 [bacterium M00.F.Ca.ET.155.01.1.1]MBW0451127.1 hypothetical protein [Paraburkholderia phenoliruptrix]MBW9101946.1 hypothetical protein [Paraburkholderia phenoliruptrix]
MSPIRTFKRSAAVVALSLLATCATSSVFAASSNTRKPVILDTQSGISDGQSGTVLQTAPLSRQPIVEAQPIAAPAELAPNSSVPIVVAPYIELPGGGATFPQQPQPGHAPHHRQ